VTFRDKWRSFFNAICAAEGVFTGVRTDGEKTCPTWRFYGQGESQATSALRRRPPGRSHVPLASPSTSTACYFSELNLRPSPTIHRSRLATLSTCHLSDGLEFGDPRGDRLPAIYRASLSLERYRSWRRTSRRLCHAFSGLPVKTKFVKSQNGSLVGHRKTIKPLPTPLRSGAAESGSRFARSSTQSRAKCHLSARHNASPGLIRAMAFLLNAFLRSCPKTGHGHACVAAGTSSNVFGMVVLPDGICIPMLASRIVLPETVSPDAGGDSKLLPQP
jgi:hypothetical protein